MIKKSIVMIFLSLLVLLSVASCDPAPSIEKQPVPGPSGGDLPGPTYCNVQISLQDKPTNIQPTDDENIKVLKPTFKWNNPYNCYFPGWVLRVWRDDPFGLPEEEVLNQVLDNSALQYQMTTNLDPNTRYRWKVGIGGYLSGAVHQANSSFFTYFWTGPFCILSKLLSPIVVSPPDGSYVTESAPHPFLVAKHPGGCAAKDFEYQLALDPSFEGDPLKMDLFVQSTNLLHLKPIPGSIHISFAQAGCSWFYWRIRALHEDGDGPWSETFSFYWEDYPESCPTIFNFFPDIPIEM